ncbi:hypothetical protein XNC1_1240 [Xenorhabdus nematophila ATCC 19061]|uniref:Uncharacterized protein n=1 Tax=Xenorhabdus nematophila (strain ATCC 19061 / DSM 3370 / CCUG 14189 / LMG 1036 / NCIMB 9965 / AN6) TaxID=406817 RepID=D3V9S3_XENNA|nr:hypothetical protein XNC1_1240 [Xenorhabdus nematophila ATCC 19061]
MILRFGNKNFANLGSSFFDTPTILTSYLEIGLGQEMLDFYEGKFKPQWKDFNSFLEWYFELA